jgi:hypothetical protein
MTTIADPMTKAAIIALIKMAMAPSRNLPSFPPGDLL